MKILIGIYRRSSAEQYAFGESNRIAVRALIFTSGPWKSKLIYGYATAL